MLCRIYKKNSSAQKPAIPCGVQSKEYSLGSSSSSSSQYDDVMDSLPEINDRFFSLPRMDSLKNFQQEDQKVLNLANLGSGNFDWATLAGLNPLPELGPAQQPQINNNNINCQNDMYAPSLGGNVGDEEVQSGIRAKRVGLFTQNADMFAQEFTNPIDPFAGRYQTQPGGLGFRQ